MRTRARMCSPSCSWALAIAANRSLNSLSLSRCMAATSSRVCFRASRRSSNVGRLGSALSGMAPGGSCLHHRMIDIAYRHHQRFRFSFRPRSAQRYRVAAQAHAPEGHMQFLSYQTEGFYDEMFRADGTARPHFQLVQEIIQSLSDGQLLRYKHAAERLLLQLGITFNVYGDTAGTDQIFPFALTPRIPPAHKWDRTERGPKQRIHALNAFIDDIYHDQKILKDGAIPAEVVTSAVSYRKQCHGLNPPWGVWCHVTGTDLVRDRAGDYYVLEDNLRVPSGVSYVLENREVLKRIFPGVFEGLSVRPVNGY